MKFTVARDRILASMSRIGRVVERRNTIPILGNVLLVAEGPGRLTLRATDLDLETAETFEAQVATSGATTVPAHMLHDILKKLAVGSEVVFESSEGKATVRSGRSRFTLHTLPQEDMPAIGEGVLDTSFQIPAADLRELIERTRFAISTEETRYYLNGIYLHVVQDGKIKVLRAVATDGHRLAQTQVAAPEGALAMPGVILPRKTVNEVHKMVEGADDEVSVDLSQTKIRFACGPVTITSKLIDGTFPDYGRVIPLGNDKIMTIDKKDFEAAVDRVSTVSSERGRAVKLALTQNRLVMTVNNPDSGNAVEEMDVDYPESAGDLEIGFNSRYLLDICQEIDGEQAVVKLSDPGAPALIAASGDTKSLFVIMPMRV
jgi:DNA polymerase-3 subunit beta